MFLDSIIALCNPGVIANQNVVADGGTQANAALRWEQTPEAFGERVPAI